RTVASGPLFVWVSNGGDNNWISLRLIGRMTIDGTGSNADAIGAKVKISHKDFNGNTITQTREVLGSSTFLSMSSLNVHFGVESADKAQVNIEWPSGAITTIENVNVNELIVITESPASR
ncbi:MAG: ASPIC/UnbV domain-containing protein, partial [Dehalococcoidia bacterium]|nr:ASPIC/UnbV domain-containing protein [Dehalococcoidia bacterium]